MSKLNAEQRVQRAHVWLMKNPKYCLYSGIFMLGKTEVKDDVPTACTDGRNVMYGREFTNKLPEAELRGVILHENKHKAFRHLSMWKHLYKEHAQLANMACDYVINQMIEDSDPQGVDEATSQARQSARQDQGRSGGSGHSSSRCAAVRRARVGQSRRHEREGERSSCERH